MQMSSSGTPLTAPAAHLNRRLTVCYSRRAVLWGVALVAVAHVALTAVVSFLVPEIRDPDQIFKLRQLQECLGQNDPARPLVLMMGSSRVAMGYRPELVERSEGPLYYNYGLCFSGPLLNLITLHRILDAGIQPYAILLEVWPPHLAAECAERTDTISLDVNRLSWNDLKILTPYSARPLSLYQSWMMNRLLSWSTYRFTLTRLFAPALVDFPDEDEVRWSGLHERGWLGQEPYRAHPPSRVYERYLLHTRFSLAKALDKPGMANDARSALQDFLDVCRQRGIQVGLIWLPESPEFRRSYSTEGLAQAAAELQAIAGREGLPVFDTNDWVPEDGFVDGYHLTHGGAALFTSMLERHVLTPFLANSPTGLSLEAGLLSKKADPGKGATSQREVPAALSIR
jgi:hypothetical protein